MTHLISCEFNMDTACVELKFTDGSMNVIFRRYFGISIASSFFFGTGILIIGAAAIVENLSIPTGFLNIFLYGSSVNACLASNVGTLIICIVVSVAWAFFYNFLGTKLLAKSDVY